MREVVRIVAFPALASVSEAAAVLVEQEVLADVWSVEHEPKGSFVGEMGESAFVAIAVAAGRGVVEDTGFGGFARWGEEVVASLTELRTW